MAETMSAPHNVTGGMTMNLGWAGSSQLTGADLGRSCERQNGVENKQIPLEESMAALSVNDDGSIAQPEVQFDATTCLFCGISSADLDGNLEHMHKSHGLFIPDRPCLIVDLETLIEYFHLVIFGYFECLYCGSQRNNPQAAQQHMLGKGHCKIDIAREGSEFRDFYDFDSSTEDSEDDNDDGDNDDDDDDYDDAPSRVAHPKPNYAQIDASMRRLPSGKVLLHRTQGKSRNHAGGTTSTKSPSAARSRPTISGSPQPPPTSSSGEIQLLESKRIAKREASLFTQLASVRATDRTSLMHLPTSQQRALVLKGKKQVERARREENAMLIKIQIKAR